MLTDSQINSLGGLVNPFERSNRIFNKDKIFWKGEDILFPSILINSPNNFPFENRISDNIAEFNSINSKKITDSRYLWIIDEEGFKIIFEQTPNLESARKIVCHTNITAGKKAVQGGELWITENNKLLINAWSGRYDNVSPQKYQEAINFLKSLNLDVRDITNECQFLRPARTDNTLTIKDKKKINQILEEFKDIDYKHQDLLKYEITILHDLLQRRITTDDFVNVLTYIIDNEQVTDQEFKNLVKTTKKLLLSK